MFPLLNQISSPSYLRNTVQEDELTQLASELRGFIIDTVAQTQGHLGASLGVVELTVALHYCFDTPNDLLVWDVGHQAYGHKILTGRKTLFHTNRTLDGISGFPKRSESNYDTFGVGHSSTSISAALGMAVAAKLEGKGERCHIAVIGDASIASGMAFEALNHSVCTDVNLLIVLNDNNIGIDPSIGALKKHFNALKKQGSNADVNFFKTLGLSYSGPIDGHDINILLSEFRRIKKRKGIHVLHVVTTKGKGLAQAEENQVKYHAPGAFDPKTGNLLPTPTTALPPKYQEVFGKTIVELAAQNNKIVGITPAMLTGSSLTMMFKEFPDRTFDVGIAEQHAVTFAAGLATEGMIPFCHVYSTFLQRAYDQVIHDVALQQLPVIFCLDRAGIVGADGPTHHGVFDLAYLRAVPNMIIFAPRNEMELRNIMFTVQQTLEQPIAIRYPRGRGTTLAWETPFDTIKIGTGLCLQEGDDIAVLSIGTIAKNVTQAIAHLPHVAHYDMRFVKPLDTNLLHDVFAQYSYIYTIEDGVKMGGFGSAVLEFASEHKYKNTIEVLGIADAFVEHGSIEELQKINSLDSLSIHNKLILNQVK
ncbi:MAG: 1-deoxy-D-xylulose-5-phosphate synthase [Aureispira sp.]